LALKILFLADTHLGLDLTFRPRVERRRRGPDFFANLERALAPALAGRVDCLVHGGDLLYRSRVPARLAEMAFEPLLRVARAGVPVFLVPGNHERSKIPYGLLAGHPLIHIFDRPRTFVLERRGFRLALAGFPYQREIRSGFGSLLEMTGWREPPAEARLLCCHHCFEGARVGPADYTFRSGEEVIKAADLPPGLAALLSGHIHRHQVLTNDLRGRPLKAPVLYPGSIERTSFAEKDEPKGCLTVRLGTRGAVRGRLLGWSFRELPARPMIQVDLEGGRLKGLDPQAWLQERLAGLDPEGVVRLRVRGEVPWEWRRALGAPSLRRLAPETMNLEAVFPDLRPAKSLRLV